MISYGICVSLSDLLSMIISRSIHVAANDIISSFLWLSNIPLCVCVCTPHLLYLFICQWTFFFFLGLHQWHMEVPRPGVKSQLQLLAYTTATTIPDPSHVCNLHHSSWQCWIPNPLSKARDWACILMDASQIRFRCATTGTPVNGHLSYFLIFTIINSASMNIGVHIFFGSIVLSGYMPRNRIAGSYGNSI